MLLIFILSPPPIVKKISTSSTFLVFISLLSGILKVIFYLLNSIFFKKNMSSYTIDATGFFYARISNFTRIFISKF